VVDNIPEFCPSCATWLKDVGRLTENVVAIALWRQQLAGGIDLAFWKNKEHEEVDFAVNIQHRTPNGAPNGNPLNVER
jgi:predicted AAA+ superfamily ATPase